MLYVDFAKPRQPVSIVKVRVSVQLRSCSLIYARAAMAHVRSCRRWLVRRGCGLSTGPVLTRVRVVRKWLDRSQTAVSVSSRVLGHVAIEFWQPISSSFAHFVRATSTLVRAVDAAAVPVAVLHRGAAHTPPPPGHRPHRCRIPRRSTSSRTTVSQHILDHGLGPQQSAKARRGHARQ